MTTIHPQCAQVLEHVDGWPDLTQLPAAEARAVETRRWRELGGALQPVQERRPVTIPVGDGVEIDAVLYRPTLGQAAGVLVWLHGGGWVVGCPEESEDQVRAIANAAGCPVLSVDYRRAPEHPFPTPAEDAYAAVAWASEHAEQLGAGPGGRIAVGGDSAGGNLAAAVTLMARDRGGPAVAFQALVYPVTCRTLPDASSRERYGQGFWLSNDAMRWCWASYAPGPGDADDPYASPLLADSLAGLPPALVLLAECDLLHDEGERYAARLRADGVHVELRVYEGMLHGFMAAAGRIDAAWDAFREVGEATGRALAAHPTEPQRA